MFSSLQPLPPCVWYSHTAVNILPNLFFLRMNSPSSLRISSRAGCTSPSVIAVALHWTSSSTSITSSCKSPEPDPAFPTHLYSQCRDEVWDHLPWPAGKSLPIGPGMLLHTFGARVHCWLMCSLSQQGPQFLFCKVFNPSASYLNTIFLISDFKILTG